MSVVPSARLLASCHLAPVVLAASAHDIPPIDPRARGPPQHQHPETQPLIRLPSTSGSLRGGRGFANRFAHVVGVSRGATVGHVDRFSCSSMLVSAAATLAQNRLCCTISCLCVCMCACVLCVLCAVRTDPHGEREPLNFKQRGAAVGGQQGAQPETSISPKRDRNWGLLVRREMQEVRRLAGGHRRRNDRRPNALLAF